MVETIGILGGGQLGRMSVQAAHKLGFKAAVFSTERNSPASQIADFKVIGGYQDRELLDRFLNHVDVVTYEFENIPIDTIRYLKEFKPVFPDERVLEISQDRYDEKSFLNSLKIPTTRFAQVNEPGDIQKVMEEWGVERLLLKTRHMGYDGKGQRPYYAGENLVDAMVRLGDVALIAEEFVSYQSEFSMIIARDRDENIALYGPIRNQHERGILRQSEIPMLMFEEASRAAGEMIKRVATSVNLRGVLCLEFFFTHDRKILANEIAPRTHNSGHWTIEACEASQFEQHVRTVCGMPVGSTTLKLGDTTNAKMTNLIGEEVKRAKEYEGQENTFVHLYGKSEARPGRKMGHVTVLSS